MKLGREFHEDLSWWQVFVEWYNYTPLCNIHENAGWVSLFSKEDSVEVTMNKAGVEVFIKASNERVVAYVKITCYFAKYPMELSAPILSRRVNGKVETIRYTIALAFLKRWGSQSGITKKLGMHCLRIGVATVRHSKECPLKILKTGETGKVSQFSNI